MFFYLSAFLFVASLFLLVIPMFSVSLVVWMITAPFDKKRVLLHRLTRVWARIFLFFMPFWKIELLGKENIVKGKTYLLAANHQSELDILLCLKINIDFKFVSKREVLYLPFFGWMIWLNRYITLRRGYLDSISKMMKQCENNLKAGSSVLLFPEGTRAKDGKLKTFKPGAYLLAEELDIPILPIVIEGAYNSFSKEVRRGFKRHRITLKILEPVTTAEAGSVRATDGIKVVEERIAKELDKLRS